VLLYQYCVQLDLIRHLLYNIQLFFYYPIVRTTEPTVPVRQTQPSKWTAVCSTLEVTFKDNGWHRERQPLQTTPTTHAYCQV